MTKTNESNFQEIDYPTIQALIERVEHALDNGLALEPEDIRLLLAAMNTLLEVKSQLSDKEITLHKLRKLLGMVRSSEKRKPDSTTTTKPKGKSTKKKSTRKPKKKIEPQQTVHHSVDGVKKGDPCPACPNGKLGKKEPKTLIRISGVAPYEATKHIIERLQCNLCDYVVSAQLPEQVQQDGSADQKYGFSARSVMAIYKHFSGIPYFHQETLNGLFGSPITASTIYDQCELVANDCMPIYRQLKQDAANAKVFFIDDTSNRILNQKPEQRPNRNGKGTRMRTGVYTSGLIAETVTGQRIYLYNTSLGHAGEFIDEILKNRGANLPAPIIMSDALSSNKPTVNITFINALCNVHARRQWFDVKSQFPEEVETILDLYDKIWENNDIATDQQLNDQERLQYHISHSLPIMERIKDISQAYLSAEESEQHSGLGKAYQYFVKHYEGLIQFCKVAGAPLDNNIIEEGLKVKIRTRKTSHFYKTAVGADVANVLTSVITTTHRNSVNAYHYLNRIQSNKEAIADNARAWLPWGELGRDEAPS